MNVISVYLRFLVAAPRGSLNICKMLLAYVKLSQLNLPQQLQQLWPQPSHHSKVAGRKNLFEEPSGNERFTRCAEIPGERMLRQDGYLSNHRCQSEALVSLTGIRGQASRRRKEKPHHGNLEQLRMRVSLKLASLPRGGSGRGMEESRGKTHKLARYSVCSKQPNALLKIFPLRACSFLNVVIMQNVFLPLFPTPSQFACCRNIQEPGREPRAAVPIDRSQRSGRRPFLPRAGHALRIFSGTILGHPVQPHWVSPLSRSVGSSSP